MSWRGSIFLNAARLADITAGGLREKAVKRFVSGSVQHAALMLDESGSNTVLFTLLLEVNCFSSDFLFTTNCASWPPPALPFLGAIRLQPWNACLACRSDRRCRRCCLRKVSFPQPLLLQRNILFILLRTSTPSLLIKCQGNTEKTGLHSPVQDRRPAQWPPHELLSWSTMTHHRSGLQDPHNHYHRSPARYQHVDEMSCAMFLSHPPSSPVFAPAALPHTRSTGTSSKNVSITPRCKSILS